MHQLRQHQLSQDYRTIDKLIDNRDFESLKDRFKNHQKTASELKNKVDFSIDAILSPSQRPVANNSSPDQHSELKKNITDSTISWLYCTRYRPPKLPRKSYFHTSSPCYPPLIFWQSKVLPIFHFLVISCFFLFKCIISCRREKGNQFSHQIPQPKNSIYH